MLEELCDTYYEAINWAAHGDPRLPARHRRARRAAARARAPRRPAACNAWLERAARRPRPGSTARRFGWGDLCVVPCVHAAAAHGQSAGPRARRSPRWLERAPRPAERGAPRSRPRRQSMAGFEMLPQLVASGHLQARVPRPPPRMDDAQRWRRHRPRRDAQGNIRFSHELVVSVRASARQLAARRLICARALPTATDHRREEERHFVDYFHRQLELSTQPKMSFEQLLADVDPGVRVRLGMDRVTGKPRGFAFAQFADDATRRRRHPTLRLRSSMRGRRTARERRRRQAPGACAAPDGDGRATAWRRSTPETSVEAAACRPSVATAAAVAGSGRRSAACADPPCRGQVSMLSGGIFSVCA